MPAAKRLTCVAGAVLRSPANRYSATLHPRFLHVIQQMNGGLPLECHPHREPVQYMYEDSHNSSSAFIGPDGLPCFFAGVAENARGERTETAAEARAEECHRHTGLDSLIPVIERHIFHDCYVQPVSCCNLVPWCAEHSLLLQAFWRSSQATRRARDDMRDTWERLYGAEGDLIDRSGCCLGWHQPVISNMCMLLTLVEAGQVQPQTASCA